MQQCRARCDWRINVRARMLARPKLLYDTATPKLHAALNYKLLALPPLGRRPLVPLKQSEPQGKKGKTRDDQNAAGGCWAGSDFSRAVRASRSSYFIY